MKLYEIQIEGFEVLQFVAMNRWQAIRMCVAYWISLGYNARDKEITTNKEIKE